MRIRKDSLLSLLQFSLLSVAILIASGLPDSITAAPKKERLVPKMLRGDFKVEQTLKHSEGECLTSLNELSITPTVTITTKKDRVSLHGRSTITAEINRRGKYKGELVKFRTGVSPAISENLKGRFKYNRKLKQVSFKGSYIVGEVTANTRSCFKQYQLKLTPIS